MRAFVLPLLLVLPAVVVLAPEAEAQTLVSPVRGAFTEVYVIAGRAIDSRGEPAAGAQLVVDLKQQGVRAEPLQATANCKGDFITSFTLRDVRASGSATVTVKGRDGSADGKATTSFDPFFRRSDVVVTLPGPWNYRCDEGQDVWPISLSVTGRIVNRTERYQDGVVSYDAKPFTGVARLRFVINGTLTCPPSATGPPGSCDYLHIDERGDFRYTFTFDRAVPPTGTMAVVIEDQVFSGEVDPKTRQAVLLIEATGQGRPAEDAPTPGPGALPVLACVALAALATRARRR